MEAEISLKTDGKKRHTQSTSSRLSRTLASIATNAAQSAQQICLVGIVFYGVFLVGDGTVSMGAMVAAVLLSSRTLAPLAQIANLFGRFNSAKIAYQRLSEFMDQTQFATESQNSKSVIRRPTLGDLEFRSVSFRYPDQELDTLEKIDLKINKGEKIAILGRNGSGKTTLIKLASGLFGSTDGLVTYDGVDSKQIHNEDLSRSIGIVLQDIQLFSGSIIENISMGREGINEEDIVQASKFQVDEFLGKMPGGYELVLQIKGMVLEDKRQAIALTRALDTSLQLYFR